MHELRIMSSEGDNRFKWDEVDTIECQEAQRQFEALVNERRYRAFAVSKDRKTSKPITEFDPHAAYILMFPQISGG